MKRLIAAVCLLSSLTACNSLIVPPPAAYGPTPSERQLKWHQLEFYGFLHFTVNTFTDKEWGYGDEGEDVFNPTDFSAEQIVSAAKMSGMKGLILTAKHHDGFCLWPSQYTEHSIKNSKWMDGKGDVVGAIEKECRKQGLKFGVYLSPWDRNHAEYGTPAYITYYRNQLRELLTQYGDIYELWWDGANGGDGYYGGAREKRKIDNLTYYDWPNTLKIVRELQPDAVVFSDGGPDIRWIGNEKGIAGEPCWATFNRDGTAPGHADRQSLNHGDRPGTHWVPGECDVSIRPGWFYHAKEDDKVRSPENLVDLYYKSIGRGASFLLNLPPDRRGRIHENDVASLKAFRRIIDATFKTNLAAGATVTASNTRGNASVYEPANVLDGDRDTYWTCDDEATSAELIVKLPRAVTFNVVDIREYIQLGQRVDNWSVDYLVNGQWTTFATGQSIGNRRLWRGDAPITADHIRLRVSGPVCPAISAFGLYREP